MNEELTIKERIKKALRAAYIGKHYTVISKSRGVRCTEECDVEHLMFGEKEMLLVGQYYRRDGYFSLEYRDAIELADNGYVERTYNRGEVIKIVHKLEEKEEQQ